MQHRERPTHTAKCKDSRYTLLKHNVSQQKCLVKVLVRQLGEYNNYADMLGIYFAVGLFAKCNIHQSFPLDDTCMCGLL